MKKKQHSSGVEVRRVAPPPPPVKIEISMPRKSAGVLYDELTALPFNQGEEPVLWEVWDLLSREFQ